MNLKIVLKFILFILSTGVVSAYKFKNSKGMLMDVDYLVSQLYLQHCTFVEVGEGICSLFVELPSDARSKYKRSIKRQMYFGNCLCSEFRAWQLCSHHLSLQRPEDCEFEEGVSCPLTSARVHRRLCDVTGMSQWNAQCNCSVPLADMQQEALCGFRTCVVSPLPSAICSPRSVCGTAHCDTSLHGALYSVKCNRKCKDHQPFCEKTGPETSVKRRVESEWTDWQPVSKCDKSSFQQSVAECLDFYGNPAFDCIGPGLLCCNNEEGDCICEVKLEEGHLKVYRYVITFSRSNDKNNNIIKVRSAGNKSHSNVWNRFIDIANNEDDSYSLFSKHKPKVYYMNINERSLPAKNLVHNLSRNFDQNIVTVATKAKSNISNTERTPFEAVTSGLKSLKSNVTSGVVGVSSNVKYVTSTSMQVQPENTLKIKEKSDFHYTQQPYKQTSYRMSEKEPFKKNQTSETLVEAHINNNNTQDNSSQHAKIKSKSKLNKEDLTKSEQKIKSKFDGKSKEQNYMENELYDTKNSRPGLTSNNEQMNKEKGDVHNVNDDKNIIENNLKISNDKTTAPSQQTHTADSTLFSSTLSAISSADLLTDVDGSKNDTNEPTEQIEVSSECVKVFNHITYNGSENSDDNGSKQLAGSSQHKTSKISETVIKNNQSDEKVKNKEESEWARTEETLLTSSNLSTMKDKIITSTQQIVINTNMRNSSTKSDSTVNTNPTSTPQVNTSNVGKVDVDEMEKIMSFASKEVLYDQNDPIQILNNLNPVLQGEAKDFNNNAYDEPEPVLKDFNKDTIDDNMYDELNNILSYKHTDVRKENKGRETNSHASEEHDHKYKHVTENFKSTHNK